MICPYCDNEYRIAAAPQVCSHCGAQLPSYDEILERRHINGRNLTFPEAPIGKYKGAGAYLLIHKDGVVFSKKNRTIPFHEIYDVSYSPGEMSRQGFLCVREWEDRRTPLSTEPIEVLKDDTAISFYLKNKDEFHYVYTFLKQCTDLNHAANPEWKEDDLLPIMGKYNGFYGYMEIGLDTVTFSKKVLFQKYSERVIPYKEIVKVIFEAGKGASRGGLWVREWEDRNIPIKKTNFASVDTTAIDFEQRYNEKMEMVYKFLEKCVQENEVLRTSGVSTFTNQQKPKKQPRGVSVPNLEYYYQRYKPNREEAIIALRIDTGMEFLEAKKSIDSVFDSWHLPAVDSSKREACCPNCSSPSISLREQQEFKNPIPYMGYYRSSKVRFLASIVRLFARNAYKRTQKGKIECACLHCGHIWMVEE